MLLVHIRKKPPAFTPPQSSLNPFASQFQPVSQNDAMLAVAHAGPIESIHEANGSSVKNRVTAQKHDFSLEAYKIQNGEPNTSPSVASDADKLLNGDSSMSSSDGVPVLSAEEREQLFEEPRNISNVMKAVMGYDPKDNERICQFFNPETGKCFKGNNCRLEHVQIMKGMDKWVTKNVPMFSSSNPKKTQNLQMDGLVTEPQQRQKYLQFHMFQVQMRLSTSFHWL